MSKKFFSLLLSFLFLGCPDEKKPPIIIPPTPTNCEYPPGNRNFTWRLDTIAWWPSFLGGVHAFSDSDAWVMGDMHGPVINGQNTSYVALHWDGNSWNEKVDFLNILMKANDVTGDDHFMVGAGWRGMPEGTLAAVSEFDNSSKKWETVQFQTKGELRSVWTDGKGYFIAVGDNGMVYTKDGYMAEWVYSKAPTEFNITKVIGVSKNEIYTRARISLATGEDFQQYWKYYNGQWIKLYDGQDTTDAVVKLYNTDNSMYDIAASRCSVTDSLKLYLIGWESFLLESKEQFLNYKITNLSELGLPLRMLGRTGVRINLYSPNDYWVFGTRYNFYHWNGIDFQKIVIPGLPNDDIRFGDQKK